MGWKPKAQLTENEIKVSLRWILRDGITSEAVVCLSSGAILVAIALSLGASNVEIGLLAGISTLSNLFQLWSIQLLRRFPYRKVFTVIVVFLARIPLIVLGGMMFSREMDGATILLIGMSIHYILSAMGGSGWNAWVKDLVPEDRLGSYFGKRSLYMQVLNIMLSLVVAFLIDVVQSQYAQNIRYLYAGYLIVAGVVGICGTLFLSKAQEPSVQMSEGNLFELLRIPLKNINFRRLMFFNGLWSFTINLAIPFFTVFMLQSLGLSMSMVMLLIVVSQLFSVLTIRYWGMLSDRYSNKSILFISAPMYSICIIGWIFVGMYSRELFNIGLLFVLHIFTGLSTSGVNLALTNIGLKLAPKKDAVIFISIKNIIASVFSAAGPIVGGWLADMFMDRHFRLSFSWAEPQWYKEMKLIYLHDWNFLFLIAGVLSIITLRFLPQIQEQGEVSHLIVRKIMKTRFRQQLKDNIFIGNLVNLHGQMKAIVKRRNKIISP